MSSLRSAETSQLDPLAERLGAATSRLQAMLRRHFAQAEITVSQARTLSTLATRGPQRLTDLALVEQVAQPSMSALIARLEVHRLVERRPDPGEPRTTLISITEEGLELWRSVVALRSKLLAAGLMLLSVSERAALRAALPALEHLVEELQGSEVARNVRP